MLINETREDALLEVAPSYLDGFDHPSVGLLLDMVWTVSNRFGHKLAMIALCVFPPPLALCELYFMSGFLGIVHSIYNITKKKKKKNCL